MHTVNDAQEKVEEAIEILANIARLGSVSHAIVQELDALCNDLHALEESFDYINDHVKDE